MSVDELKKLGLLCWSIPTDNWEPEVDRIAQDREYKNRDRLNVTKEGLGDQYEAKLKMFFNELVPPLPSYSNFNVLTARRHLHEDEEIRYIFEGSGYFDVRGKPEKHLSPHQTSKPSHASEIQSDKWIRIRVEPSDLLVLPAGIYHRFTLDSENCIKVLRLFKVCLPSFIFASRGKTCVSFQEDPKWTPLNRSPETDANPYRVTYVQEILGTA